MAKVDIVVVNGHGLGEYCDVKTIPKKGETVRAYNRRFYPEDAGKGTNTACAIGRLGGSVGFLGKAGDDEGGRLGIKWMSEAGVDLTHYWLDPEVPTDLGLCIIAEDGTNMNLDFDDDSHSIQVEEINEHLPQMKGARFLTAGFSQSIASGLRACELGKELGMYTFLNPSPLEDDPGLPKMPWLDVMVVNETEANILLDLPRDEATDDKDKNLEYARQLRQRYECGAVIITLGDKGSVASTKDGDWFVDPTPVTMVDQIGAGDGYLGAIAWRMSEGDDLKAAMEWASVYCAYLVTVPCSLMSYPTIDKIPEIFAKLKK